MKAGFLGLAILFMFMPCLPALAQQVNIGGKVTDGTSGEPVAGAVVLVKGTNHGATTDSEGKYSLTLSTGNSILEVSCIGYKTVEIPIDGRHVIDVVMEEDLRLLDEVVVIGYGTLDKRELTSAVAHIGSKDFLSISGADPASLIQGKVSGVSIQNIASADPNYESSIQIRGISSRSAGLGPLIVVDGVPGGNMSNINQNDIESIDILKDGAASAIYGTRGSNGVVLVTTKKGNRDGAFHTTYTGITSANLMIHELDMLSAEEFRKYKVETGQAEDFGGNVDWLKEISRAGLAHQHTLTMSGGTREHSYRASIDYKKANGIDKRSERAEYGARATVIHNSKNGLFTFNANIAPRLICSKAADWHVFHNAIEANPTSPIFDPENPSLYFSFQGQRAEYNPVEELRTEMDDSEIKFLDWDATARLNVNQQLNAQVTFADQQKDYYRSWFRPSTNTESNYKGYTGEASKNYSKSSQYSLECLANYRNSFGGHNVNAMAGYSYQYFRNSGFHAENKNFPNDGITYNNLSQGEWAKEEGFVGLGSYKNDAKLIAFFGRIRYDYKGRYLVTASIRHEGSSKFGANNKWGNFPALSAGWRISEERFMRGIRWIDDLKVRADYGVTGNQNFDSYLSLNTMTGFGDYCYNGKYFAVWGPSKNVNPDLRWERGINWNLGLDFSFWDARFSGSVNYYNRTQKDLLGDYNVPIPPYLFPTTFVNVGTMTNSGIELDANIRVLGRKDFSYNISLTGACMNNKFVSFSNSEYVGQKFYDVCGTEDPFPFHYLQRIEEGERIGNFFMYKYAAFNRQGEWLIYDKEGNLKPGLEATDEDMQVVGNGLPKFTASMTHNIRYKNWDLSLFFRGAFGFDIFNIHELYYGMPGMTSNVMKLAFEKNAIVVGNPLVCDYFLEKGDYLKLDVATLGYLIKFHHKAFDSLRLYLTGRNLLTLTGFTGVDPATYNINGLTPGATGSRNYYPTCRQLIFGVQLDF